MKKVLVFFLFFEHSTKTEWRQTEQLSDALEEVSAMIPKDEDPTLDHLIILQVRFSA